MPTTLYAQMAADSLPSIAADLLVEQPGLFLLVLQMGPSGSGKTTLLDVLAEERLRVRAL